MISPLIRILVEARLRVIQQVTVKYDVLEHKMNFFKLKDKQKNRNKNGSFFKECREDYDYLGELENSLKKVPFLKNSENYLELLFDLFDNQSSDLDLFFFEFTGIWLEDYEEPIFGENILENIWSDDPEYDRVIDIYKFYLSQINVVGIDFLSNPEKYDEGLLKVTLMEYYKYIQLIRTIKLVY